MGRYIDWADVTHRYKSLGRDFDATKVNDQFIPYAEAYVDGKLGVAFTLPFSSNNLTVKDLCINLVYIKVGNLKTKDSNDIKKMVDDTLKDIVGGSHLMITASGDSIAMDNAGLTWVEGSDYHPVFGMGDIEDFHVDSSQLYTEAEGRK